MTKTLLALICVIVLRADGASHRNYLPGTVWRVSHELGSRQYEYEINDETPAYVYISRSSKEIRVTPKTKVMFAIEGKSLYIIDENGKSQKTSYLRKVKLQPPPPPVF